ncbi:putative signal transduction histidine kinase [Desulfotomaculum nigrificans CO-1-SRB]|uniref:histidine kinase n=1 Tax=Desulfotomaculum nigrificans (strain DSM 14880 / VKM B-2319 / CO-1-SRB) TaxID=868595 RepID=F6B7C8_DESCC|nr:histidine kinase [Desulfotomaculum nigrificans]AEF93378.1 putative signal transduction histidine kinase [Desulfotomaculum nigrificans CO-1-SRB]
MATLYSSRGQVYKTCPFFMKEYLLTCRIRTLMKQLRLLSQWLNQKFGFRIPDLTTVLRLLAAQLAIGLIFVLWQPTMWGQVLAICGLSFGATFVILGCRPMRRVLTVRVDEKSVAPTLQIANETLPFLRRGLNEETARQTAEIIQKISDVAAVAITDRERVLAFLGTGCEHHPVGGSIVTRATREVIATGELKVVQNKSEFNCPVKDCNCPLEAAVIAPLICKGKVVGTVKLYQTHQGHIPGSVIKLAVGVAQLLGVQMELAELDRQAQLATKAELDALQAQINPHFLFNTINTISMFTRTNPETARRLLIRLSSFFRHSLKRHGRFITLEEELEYIHTYLVLEKARFREKLRVLRNIDKSLLQYNIPVLTVQPLVENAVRHGITPKEGQGTVQISAQLHGDEIEIAITDDGVGIPPEIMPKILEPGFGSGSGVGLSNVNERLKILFGEDHGLHIESEPGQGTAVWLRVPLMVDDD